MDQHPTGDHADTPPPPPTPSGVPSDPRTGAPTGDHDRPERRPDPGTPNSRRITFWLALVLFLLVAWMQNHEAIFGSPEPAEAVEFSAPGPGDALVTGARATIGLRELFSRWGLEPGFADAMLIPKIDQDAPEQDQLRLLILKAELEGISAADQDLARLRRSLDADDEAQADLLADIETIDLIWGEGVTRVHPDDLERLNERHAWFASLAMVIGEPDEAAARAELLKDARSFATRLLSAGAAMVGLAGLGLLCFLIALYMFAKGKLAPRFVPPAPGGSVYLEMLPLFLAGFMAIGVVVFLISAIGVQVPVVGGAVLQWSLLLVVLWPVFRGVPWARVRHDLGLIAPRGVTREILCGVFGYLAGIPLLLAGMALSLLIMNLWNAVVGEPPNVHNPIADRIAQAGFLELLLLFSLATLWAPIVEELVFRGGMYRHLRARFRVVFSAIVVGLVFTLVHAYGPTAVPVLTALAVTFALLREWRNSIIASMTAHFIHNSLVLTAMYFVLFS